MPVPPEFKKPPDVSPEEWEAAWEAYEADSPSWMKDWRGDLANRLLEGVFGIAGGLLIFAAVVVATLLYNWLSP